MQDKDAHIQLNSAYLLLIDAQREALHGRLVEADKLLTMTWQSIRLISFAGEQPIGEPRKPRASRQAPK